MGLFDKLKQTVGNEPLGKVNGKKAKQAKEAKEKNTESHLSRPNRKKVKKSYKSLFHSNKKDNSKKEMKDNDLTFMKNNKNKKVQSTASMDTMKKEMLNGYSEGDSEDPTKYIKSNSLGGRNKAMILQSLHIEDNKPLQGAARELGIHLLTPDEAENVQFDISTPSGVKLEQVEEYCDLVTSNISLLIERINKLSDDKNKLIDEIQRVENKALKDLQSQQMEQVLNQGSSERDKLQNELLDAKMTNKKINEENQTLRNKMKTINTSNNNSALIDENNKLKETINQLKLQLQNNNSTNEDKQKQLTQNNDKLQAALSEIQKLKQEREELQKQIPETQTQLTSAIKKLEATQKELVQVKTLATKRKAKLRQLELEKTSQSNQIQQVPSAPSVSQAKNKQQSDTTEKKEKTVSFRDETEDEYEQRIINSIAKKNDKGEFKHVRPLTSKDRKKMLTQLRQVERNDDIKIKGINAKEKPKTGDSAFDNMMNELETKD